MRNPFRDDLGAARARAEALENENRELRARLAAAEVGRPARSAKGKSEGSLALVVVSMVMLSFFGIVHVLTNAAAHHSFACHRNTAAFVDRGRSRHADLILPSPASENEAVDRRAARERADGPSASETRGNGE